MTVLNTTGLDQSPRNVMVEWLIDRLDRFDAAASLQRVPGERGAAPNNPLITLSEEERSSRRPGNAFFRILPFFFLRAYVESGARSARASSQPPTKENHPLRFNPIQIKCTGSSLLSLIDQWIDRPFK